MKNRLLKNFIKFLNGSGRVAEYIKSIDFPSELMGDNSFDLHEFYSSGGEGGNINFYPSSVKGGCYEVAMFVSISKPPNGLNLKEGNCIPLDLVLKKMVQQVLGSCEGINQEILLITDEIDTKAAREWEGNLKAIKRRCASFDIFYLLPDGDYKNVNDLFGV